MSNFESVLAAIDAANAKDPRSVETENGVSIAVELLYGQRMSDMAARFCPEADELVQIAARGQHIERWVIPRDDFPRDRPGYFRWRNSLKRHHAARVTEIMAEHGYGEEDQAVVSSILSKKNLKTDLKSQAVEDLACLVFLKFYAVDFAKDYDAEKVVNIIAKTLPKMSEASHAFVAELDLASGLLEAIGAAKAKLAEAAKD